MATIPNHLNRRRRTPRLAFTTQRISREYNSMRHRPLMTTLLSILIMLAPGPFALAWDEEGHVIITHVAYEKLPPDMPAWLRTEKVRNRLEYLSAEPDRWRGQHNIHLDHINNPDHFIDAEDLKPYGLTLLTLPPLRRELIDLLAVKRTKEPEAFPKRDPDKDRDYTRLVPGLLPYRIAETQWKLAASWTTLKTYEQYRSYVTDDMIDNARQNVVYQMGLLSHYAGDGSQPLHLTRHYNGWVGDNPKDYTTDRSFHAYIDGGVIEQQHITKEDLASRARAPKKISTEDYWPQTCEYLNETFKQVEPLYEMEKHGDLEKPSGKAFLEERLLEGGSMLCGVWIAAYQGAHIDDFRVNQLLQKKTTTQKK